MQYFIFMVSFVTSLCCCPITSSFLQIELARRSAMRGTGALAGDDRLLLEDNARPEENEDGRGRSVRGRNKESAASEGWETGDRYWRWYRRVDPNNQ